MWMMSHSNLQGSVHVVGSLIHAGQFSPHWPVFITSFPGLPPMFEHDRLESGMHVLFFFLLVQFLMCVSLP